MFQTYARCVPTAICLTVAFTLISASVASARSMQAQPIEVGSTEPWTDTDISVRAGEKVTVAAEGRVHFGPGPLDAILPAGVPWGEPCEAYASRGGTWTVEGLPCWSLIARVDEGEPIAVGDRATFEAPADGSLQLGVNDNVFADNSGAWSVTVDVEPAPTPDASGSDNDAAGGDSGGGGGSSILPLVVAALGVLLLVGLIVFALRRRSYREEPAAEPGAVAVAASGGAATPVAQEEILLPTADQETVVPGADESVDVNIFEVKVVDGTALRVGYNYFPEGTRVRWSIVQGAAARAGGEFVTNGGGSTYHYVTLPFDTPVPVDPAGSEVSFTWVIGGVPFEYSVIGQQAN
jgi:hypothetical protein